ncbi:MAG TPA: YfiR family protein [Steroidobacteraceae bacterium]
MTLRKLAARAALAATLLLPATGLAVPDEYQVKAVFLFNFGQFVEWPGEAFDTPQAPFVICVMGEDPFGRTLDDVIRGESVGTRSLVVRRLDDTSDVPDCNILFVSRGDNGLLTKAVQAARGHSVLTVTDIEGAEHQGAMIVLFNENNRVRMRINLAAARASNLVISSKLLRPAEVIGREGG